MSEVDCIVVGAGVVGMAVARHCARAGFSTVLLERHRQPGLETSARNSGVIHSGIHNPPESLKASLCLRGAELLRHYCEERQVPHRLCGKLIIAGSNAELGRLETLQLAARERRIPGARLIETAELRQLEPELRAIAAICLPAVGVVDVPALLTALLADFEAAGGIFLPRNEVESVTPASHGFEVQVLGSPGGLRARTFVNAAGLWAQELAQRIEGLPAERVPRRFLAKGNYFELRGASPFSHLVYPLPVEGGLGIHLTLSLDGRARFGPDVEWVETIDHAVSTARAAPFYVAIRHYWPALPDGSLSPAYAGHRPKLSGPGMPAADFSIQDAAAHGVPGLLCLYGIESPGLTAALAIGEAALDRLRPHLQ